MFGVVAVIPRPLRRSLLVAKVRVIRQYRSTLEQPWLAFLQVFAVLFGSILVVGRLPLPGYAAVWNRPGAYEFGRRVAVEGTAVAGTVRGFAGVVFVVLVFLTVLKEATDGALDTNADAVLLATDARTVAVGEIAWSTAFAGWQFGVPLLAAALAFGAGARSVAGAVGVAVAGGLLVATAVPVGYATALGLRLAFQALPALRENKLVLGAPLAVGYFALFLRARQSVAALSTIPLGWFGDLGLVGVPGAGADPMQAAAVLLAAPLAVVGLALGAGRIGEASWYGDRPREEEVAGDRVPAALDRVLTGVSDRPAAAVARSVWIRLGREPKVLLFAGLPIALTATFGAEVVGRRPEALPVVVAAYVAAAVGMGATLNPLGNLGAGLPVALTTPGGARAVVRGYVLSAAIPGVPLVVGLATLAGVAVGLDPGGILAAALVGAALTVGAAVVSMWIGVLLPNYESLRATSESGVRPPRLWATTAFLLAMVLLGLPALIGVGWGPVLAEGAALPAPAFVVAGAGTTLLATAAVGAVAYRRTLSAIEEYRID